MAIQSGEPWLLVIVDLMRLNIRMSDFAGQPCQVAHCGYSMWHLEIIVAVRRALVLDIVDWNRAVRWALAIGYSCWLS